MIPIGPIEDSILGRARNAPRGDLLDVDVGEVFFDVFGYCEGDGCEGYGFAEEPAYALLLGRLSLCLGG